MKIRMFPRRAGLSEKGGGKRGSIKLAHSAYWMSSHRKHVTELQTKSTPPPPSGRGERLEHRMPGLAGMCGPHYCHHATSLPVPYIWMPDVSMA